MKWFLMASLMMSSVAFANSKKTEVLVLSERNTVVLDEPVTASSAARVVGELYAKSAKTKDDLFLVLYTPGGSVSAGSLLIDNVKALPNKVHTVTIFAASMGYQIAQQLNTRFILSSGTLMSHRARIGGLSGQVPGEANTRLQFIDDMVADMEKIAAARVGISFADYRNLIYNEYWTTGYRAVAANHADKVVSVRCDESLQGTRKRVFNTLFGSFTLNVHKCPLIIGATDDVSDSLGKEIQEKFFTPAKNIEMTL